MCFPSLSFSHSSTEQKNQEQNHQYDENFFHLPSDLSIIRPFTARSVPFWVSWGKSEWGKILIV
jgi:hypothetical protein